MFVCLFACLDQAGFVDLFDRWCLWRTRRSRSKLSCSLSTDRVRAASVRTVPCGIPCRAEYRAVCRPAELRTPRANCAVCSALRTALSCHDRSQYTQRSTIRRRVSQRAATALHGTATATARHGTALTAEQLWAARWVFCGRCAGGDAHPRLDRAGRAHVCEGPAADALRCTVRRGQCNMTCNMQHNVQHIT